MRKSKMGRPSWGRWLVIAAGIWALVALLWLVNNVCLSAYFRYGLALRHCPDGRVRQTVSVNATGLRRGGVGHVNVRAIAHYTVADSDHARSRSFGKFEAQLSLVDAAGHEQPLRPVAAWSRGSRSQTARVKLPEVPDGDYRLRTRLRSRLGESQLDVPLPLYTPARIHVITDRPLYEPGQLVRFRAVVLRARDLVPLDGRPGRWRVLDPSGEVLLEEKAPAGPWGVVAGSFPLDQGAPQGRWRVSWVSGTTSAEAAFTVKPFTLPRFRVEAAPEKPSYRAGDEPEVKGAVVYSSGAPVAGAKVDLSWRVQPVAGDWPPPTDWLGGRLPRRVVAGPDGRFALKLPEVPADLQGQVTLLARLSAVDPAGDRVEGSLSVLLSQDPLQVSTVTELADGLVEGFNNRMYLRVTTADGRPLPGATVRVQRAWMPDDPGITTKLDEDSVGSLQIDPGPPVNVVLPPKPVRRPKRPPPVSRGQTRELISGENGTLADQLALDGWLKPLEACARYADSSHVTVRLALRVDETGAVREASTAGKRALDRCVMALVAGRRLPAGAARLYAVTLSFSDPGLPRLRASLDSALDAPEGLAERLAEALRAARDCLPAKGEGPLPKLLLWQVKAKSQEVSLTWAKNPRGQPSAAMACIEQRVGKSLLLDHEPAGDRLGVARVDASAGDADERARPRAQTLLGYEFLVTADVEGQPSTRLRMRPGQVPPLRLRATPVVAKAGDRIRVELIRGPSYAGSLPKKLELLHLRGRIEAELNPESRTAEFKLDPTVSGFCQIRPVAAWGYSPRGSRGAGPIARIFVRPDAELSVRVTPDKERYAPGQTATLSVQTVVGARGGQAAVGLFGVDESLAQLVPLPGPDELGSIRPKVQMSSPAFGVLDGQALLLGRIRGAAAQAATLLRVSQVPSPPSLDAVVNVSGETTFDPVEPLTDRFYLVLAELRDQVRAWEAKAPKSEKMRPQRLAELWQRALAEVEKRGQPVEDAFGRRLRLHRLPDDLLALTDPRLVVSVGTRLPEDVENWPAWVRRVRP